MQDFFPKNKDGKYESALNSEYQSTFLPIFQRAETQIKLLIVKYLWQLKSERLLKEIIADYIKTIDKKIPKNLPNRKEYIDGLKVKSEKLIKDQKKARNEFAIVLSLLITNVAKNKQKQPKLDKIVSNIKTPQQLYTFLESPMAKKVDYRMWEQAKASVRVQNYGKSLETYIDKLAQIPTTTYAPGKKPISLWQKAELDVRYSHQIAMVEDAILSGDDLWWISSHPDCSKRCEKWQGKLVSVTKKSTMSGFRVGKVDGIWVYSLQDIMAQKDKYGYNNNIICGFNCRHYLIKYESGKKPPKEFSKQDVAKMRAINDKIREYERKIRFYKTQEKLYNSLGNTKKEKFYHQKANQLTVIYKKYCEKNGFAWQEYRIKIM